MIAKLTIVCNRLHKLSKNVSELLHKAGFDSVDILETADLQSKLGIVEPKSLGILLNDVQNEMLRLQNENNRLINENLKLKEFRSNIESKILYKLWKAVTSKAHIRR